MWAFEKKNKFKQQFKRLSKELQAKVKTALIEMASVPDPTRLGIYKQSMKVYAYELNRNYRIIYNVNFNENIIELIRVGDHKDAYGKG